MKGRRQLRSDMFNTAAAAATATTLTSKTTFTISLSDNIIERRIESTTEGLPSECFKSLHNRVLPANKENAMIICDYITSLRSEVNPSDGHRKNIVILLSNFSIFFKKAKSFKDLTREDIFSFLDSFRKIESVDPLHKWIGTYNLYRAHLVRFFKWLYNPDIEPDKRPKPEVVQNIPPLKRKEKSIYKPTDLWTLYRDKTTSRRHFLRSRSLEKIFAIFP